MHRNIYSALALCLANVDLLCSIK